MGRRFGFRAATALGVMVFAIAPVFHGGALAAVPVAPTVLSVTPPAGATGVLLNRVVSASFSAPMKCSTLTTTTFKLKNSKGVAIGGSVKCSGSTATFTPSANLAPSTTFTATLSTGVTNLSGTPLAATKKWSFTTARSGTDTVKPSVSSFSPASGAAGVSALPSITATFSEAVDCATVNGSTFKLLNGAGTPVRGAFACSGRKATLTPTSPLQWSTKYTVSLTTGIRDLARNALSATKSWSFRTAAAPDLFVFNAAEPEGTSEAMGGKGSTISFKVMISPPAPMPVTVNYLTLSGTALGGKACEPGAALVDYVSTSGTLTIPAGGTSGAISVTVCGDGEIEDGDESFTLELSNQTGGVNLVSGMVTGTILNDDLAALNDTMATEYYDDSGITDYVSALSYPEQDGFVGRDVANGSISWSDGWLGFSFVKLGSDGKPIAIQDAYYDNLSGTEVSGSRWSCVLDNVTGLTWETRPSDATWRAAANTYYLDGSDATDTCALGVNCLASNYVAAVNSAALCGHSDWRIPSRAELQTLATHTSVGPGNPTVEMNYLPNMFAGSYWSSTDHALDSTWAWTLDFGLFGFDTEKKKDTLAHLLLVRGGTVPARRFTAQVNGTVYDALTGLTWKRCAEGFYLADGGNDDPSDDICILSDPGGSGTFMNWQTALTTADTATFAGYSDWRLPNAKELQSIVDSSRVDPAIDPLFLGTMNGAYWSSTTYEPLSSSAEMVWFTNGTISSADKAGTNLYVRLVR